jgi:nucleotide-binding universal stress UspA family protein
MTPKRILIPTDGSRLSRRAIAYGVALAKSIGASVVGFHARPLPQVMYYGDATLTIAPTTEKLLEQEGVRAAEKHLAVVAAAAKQAGVRCKSIQSMDLSPAEAIIRTARRERCDLIVMASHGRKGVSRLLLGSETNHVLTHSRIPVLVTR